MPIICFALLIIIIAAHLEGSEMRTIRLTSGEWPPYTSASLKHYGIISQIVSEAYAKEGYLVDFDFYPGIRSLKQAKLKSWDGSLPWQPTKEREAEFLFSNPVLTSRNVFFHRKDRDFQWKKLADLKGLKIGTAKGYAYSSGFRKSVNKIGINLIDSDSDLVNMKLLLDGRIDLLLCDINVGLFLLANHFKPQKAQTITYNSRDVFQVPLSLVFPKNNRRSSQLKVAFNNGLAKLKNSGKYNTILSPVENDKPLLVALSHWPPWKITRGGKFTGIDVEILKSISKRTGIRFEYRECPWKRCIELVGNGKADLITSFGKTPKREKIVYYIEPPYTLSTVVFYRKKGSPVEISDYDQLRNYKIGVIKGSVYFDHFDKDDSLNKTAVTRKYQLINMLLSERIDLIVGYEYPTDYSIALMGKSDQLEKLSFNVKGVSESYFAISKKSSALKSAPVLGAALHRMVQQNEVRTIIKTYLRNLPADKE